MNQYVENFKCAKDIIEAYRAPADAFKGAKIYLAWYGYGDCSGSSLVIYEKDGQLYEVNGSHCSCNGLEGCWEPEETSWEALAKRQIYGSDCQGREEAQNILDRLVKRHLRGK